MSSTITPDLIKSVAQIAAPAGIAIGASLCIGRDIIAKIIFPNLTKKQNFRIIMFMAFTFWTVALSGMAIWAYVSIANSSAQPPVPIAYPPLSMEVLKNLTYRIDDDFITLQDGKREFAPDTGRELPDKDIAVYLVDHAFGDTDGDGNSDAIAVLQASDGGSGIYYYLATVFNDRGTARSYGKAYVLGDRLEIRSVSIQGEKIIVQLMMHADNDGLCCPTQFRTLEFVLKERKLQCTTEPCSEI